MGLREAPIAGGSGVVRLGGAPVCARLPSVLAPVGGGGRSVAAISARDGFAAVGVAEAASLGPAFGDARSGPDETVAGLEAASTEASLREGSNSVTEL